MSSLRLEKYFFFSLPLAIQSRRSYCITLMEGADQMKREKTKQYSLSTIAAELGVSKSAVSFVLSGKAHDQRISRDLEKKILDFCAKVNYRPNIHAQRMNSDQVKNIGILLDENISIYQKSPFQDLNAASIVGGIADAAAAAGYRFSCQIYSPKMSCDDVFDWFRNKEIAGLIYYGMTMPVSWIETFKKENYKAVGISIDPAYGVPCVNVDNYGASFELTCHLIRQGRRKFLYVTGTDTAYPGRERLRGFLDALKIHKISFSPDHILSANFDRKQAAALIRSLWIHDKLDADAIVCANDYMAIGVIQSLRDAGISIPEQIAVAGADNINLCEIISPSLTSFDYQTFEMGKAAFALLKDLISGLEPHNVVLKTTLSIRCSG